MAVERLTPRGIVNIGCRHPDSETQLYAKQIGDLLGDAGYVIKTVMNHPDDLHIFNPNSDIGFFFDNIGHSPPCAFSLIAGFLAMGSHPTIFTNDTRYTSSPREASGISNEVVILVGEKPVDWYRHH